jgi:hypothetical protein
VDSATGVVEEEAAVVAVEALGIAAVVGVSI